MSVPRERLISASHIGRYAYCARAWWLGSVMEVTPTNTREIARGELVHARHGRRVWLSGALVWVAGVLIVLALLVVLLTQRAG